MASSVCGKLDTQDAVSMTTCVTRAQGALVYTRVMTCINVWLQRSERMSASSRTRVGARSYYARTSLYVYGHC